MIVLPTNNSYQLKAYNYRNAITPIYDSAGGQRVAQNATDANSYLGVNSYGSLIKVKDQAGNINYPRATTSSMGTNDNAVNIG